MIEKGSTGRASRGRWNPATLKRGRQRTIALDVDESATALANRHRKWVILAVLLLWEAIMRVGLINSLFFAAPSEVVIASVELVRDEAVRNAVITTGGRFLAALVIAATAGILFGALLGLSNVAYRALHPIVVMFFATPSMIFIPLVILALGTGFQAKVFYAAAAGFFPITVTVTAGARSVDRKFREAARSMGASGSQMIWHVLVPASLPSVFASLWYGLKHCLLGILIMELFASRMGIGYFLRVYTSSFRMDRVLVLILAVSFLAIGMAKIWGKIEERLMHWQPRQ